MAESDANQLIESNVATDETKAKRPVVDPLLKIPHFVQRTTLEEIVGGDVGVEFPP